MARQSPKWPTAERKAHLVKLWAMYGNRCLHGHTACPNPNHYVHHKPKAVTVAKAVHLPCVDRQGNPIRDREGNQVYLTLYRPTPTIVHEATVCRLYDVKSEQVIADWQADDRAQRQAEAKVEQRAIHGLAERGAVRGRFSAIGRDIFFGQQPQYYLEGLGISGLTFKPFAKVRLASSYVNLFVDIGDTLRGLSKSKKRKAIRYGKALPPKVQEAVDEVCNKAVRHYLR